ncbi:hypothetical protein YC2023_098173 [Brassica napus]
MKRYNNVLFDGSSMKLEILGGNMKDAFLQARVNATGMNERMKRTDSIEDVLLFDFQNQQGGVVRSEVVEAEAKLMVAKGIMAQLEIEHPELKPLLVRLMQQSFSVTTRYFRLSQEVRGCNECMTGYKVIIALRDISGEKASSLRKFAPTTGGVKKPHVPEPLLFEIDTHFYARNKFLLRQEYREYQELHRDL